MYWLSDLTWVKVAAHEAVVWGLLRAVACRCEIRKPITDLRQYINTKVTCIEYNFCTK